MTSSGIPWGPVRSTLIEKFSFGEIKQIVGYGGLDMPPLAHLEQQQYNGASKNQLLSAIDRQVGVMEPRRLGVFVSICCEEMMRRKASISDDLDRILSRVGWKFSGRSLIPIDIFDVAELPDLPGVAQAELEKAASRLRDGDLSGAVSSACGALDVVTSEIYQEFGLGDASSASFQERIKKSVSALRVEECLARELSEIGWLETDYRPFCGNIVGSLNQAAYVMQKLRSDMGDVHGTKQVIHAFVYDSIKWSALLLRVLAVRPN